jgi:hypothetical protein
MKAAQLGIVLLLLALIVQDTAAQSAIVGCSAWLDAYIYNMHPVEKSGADYNLSLSTGTNATRLYFNLCSNTVNKCKGSSDFANI